MPRNGVHIIQIIMMLRAFTWFVVMEDGKEILRTPDLEELRKLLEHINFIQHSGRFKRINILCLWNPDMNMEFQDECIEMDMDDIKPNPVHIEEESHIEEIRDLLKEKGRLIPLSVDLNNNLLDGHHRYHALKALGIKKVKVLKKSREWYKTMEEHIREKAKKIDLSKGLWRNVRYYKKDD